MTLHRLLNAGTNHNLNQIIKIAFGRNTQVVLCTKTTFVSQQNYVPKNAFSSKFPTSPRRDDVQISRRSDWDHAVNEAERIVDFPSAFSNLQSLLSDKSGSLALYLDKLVGSNHPLVETTKNMLYNRKRVFGLIVLLLSKAAGCGIVSNSQRSLAEITEMIHISHSLHSSLVNLNPSAKAANSYSNEVMLLGNKIGLLTGDYFLTKSFGELANLYNVDTFSLMLSSIRDFSESEFIGERDEQNNPLPSKPGTTTFKANGTTTESIEFDENDRLVPLNIASAMGIPEKEWECRNILNAGSLLGKSCQGALKLAGQSEKMQRQAYLFGKHLSLAWQACIDTDPFQSSSLPKDGTFSLVSAPVLFHLEYDPSIYAEIEKGKISVDRVDYEKLHKAILAGPALEKTKELQRKHTSAAMLALEHFPPSDSRTAIGNIMLAN